jgi:hypothetical protein
MVCFQVINVFPQLNWIELFGKKRAYLHLDKPLSRKSLFQKLIQSSQGNNVLDAPVPKNDGFLSRDIGVSSPQLNRPIWNTMSLSPPWELWCAKCILLKTDSFAQEPMSYILHILPCLLSLQRCMFLQISWICLFVTKGAFLYLENFKFQKYSFEKKELNSQTKWNKVLDASACKMDVLVLRATWVASPFLKCPLATIWAFLHLETWKLQEVLLSKPNSSNRETMC